MMTESEHVRGPICGRDAMGPRMQIGIKLGTHADAEQTDRESMKDSGIHFERKRSIASSRVIENGRNPECVQLLYGFTNWPERAWTWK